MIPLKHSMPGTGKALFRKTWEIARESGVCHDEWEPWYECFKASTLWPVGNAAGELTGVILFHGMGDGSVMMHCVIRPDWEGRWINKTILKAFRNWKPGVPVVTLVADDPVRVKGVELFGFSPMQEKREPVLGHAWFVRN